jgi:hypothetical protein
VRPYGQGLRLSLLCSPRRACVVLTRQALLGLVRPPILGRQAKRPANQSGVLCSSSRCGGRGNPGPLYWLMSPCRRGDHRPRVGDQHHPATFAALADRLDRCPHRLRLRSTPPANCIRIIDETWGAIISRKRRLHGHLRRHWRLSGVSCCQQRSSLYRNARDTRNDHPRRENYWGSSTAELMWGLHENRAQASKPNGGHRYLYFPRRPYRRSLLSRRRSGDDAATRTIKRCLSAWDGNRQSTVAGPPPLLTTLRATVHRSASPTHG